MKFLFLFFIIYLVKINSTKTCVFIKKILINNNNFEYYQKGYTKTEINNFQKSSLGSYTIIGGNFEKYDNSQKTKKGFISKFDSNLTTQIFFKMTPKIIVKLIEDSVGDLVALSDSFIFKFNKWGEYIWGKSFQNYVPYYYSYYLEEISLKYVFLLNYNNRINIYQITKNGDLHSFDSLIGEKNIEVSYFAAKRLKVSNNLQISFNFKYLNKYLFGFVTLDQFFNLITDSKKYFEITNNFLNANLIIDLEDGGFLNVIKEISNNIMDHYLIFTKFSSNYKISWQKRLKTIGNLFAYPSGFELSNKNFLIILKHFQNSDIIKMLLDSEGNLIYITAFSIGSKEYIDWQRRYTSCVNDYNEIIYIDIDIFIAQDASSLNGIKMLPCIKFISSPDFFDYYNIAFEFKNLTDIILQKQSLITFQDYPWNFNLTNLSTIIENSEMKCIENKLYDYDKIKIIVLVVTIIISAIFSYLMGRFLDYTKN